MSQNTLAVAPGPIEYTDPVSGSLTVIPVGALSFDSSGKLVIANPYAGDASLSTWLTYLVSSKFVTAAVAAPAPPAMILTATTPGSEGNHIQVTITITNAALGQFTIKVAETDTYAGLSPSTIGQVLGINSTPGSQPGLVLLQDLDVPAFPVAVNNQALSNGTSQKAATLTVPAASGNAFVLQAKSAGTAGNQTNVTIQIDNTNPANPVFSLQSTWSQTVTNVTTANVNTQVKSLAYIVTFAPPGGGTYGVPSDNNGNPYQLANGIDGATPAAASVTIPDSNGNPAMVVTAATPGSQGNNIAITIVITDKVNGVFSITATETDQYSGLTAATVSSVLGTVAVPGSRPGLVIVQDTDAPTLPKATASAQAMTGGNPTTPASLAVPSNAGTAFTLVGKAPSADGNLTQIQISNVNAVSNTFDVTATWTKSASADLTTVAVQLQALGYVVAVTAPPNGFSLPSDNGGAPLSLSGGADGTTPTAATLSVPSS